MPINNQVYIRLDLAAGARKAQMSADNYSNLVQGVLVPADLLYTYAFRYGRLIAYDLPSAHGISVATQGPMIDYTMQHPLVGAAVTVAVAGVSAATTYYEYKRQKKFLDNHSYKAIFDTFENASAPVEKPADNLDDINDYLLKVLEDDAALREKYELFAVDLQTKKFVVILKDHTKEEDELAIKKEAEKPGLFKKFTNKVLSPLWEALCLSSFTYWILWVGSGIITGQFGVGIAGVPTAVAFGLPLLAGLAYPAIKIYNYFKNKRKSPQVGIAADENEPQATDDLSKQTEIDACALLRRALLRREFEMQKKALRAQINELGGEPNPENVAAASAEQADDMAAVNSIDEKISGLTKNKWTKTAVTLISVMGGTFIALQYGAWLVTDILNTLSVAVLGIPAISMILGAGMMVLAGVYGLYAAYNRYKEVGKHQANEKIIALKDNQLELNNLEARLKNNQDKIASYEKKLELAPAPVINKYVEEQFFNDVTRPGPSKWTRFKKIATRAFHFINGVCTGIFLGRIFLVKGTAIALPFAAAMLSNPITIGVLAGIGVLYGSFKLYQYIERRKEERALQLFEQRAERIACLKQEVELSGLREQLLSIEVKNKEAKDRIMLERILDDKLQEKTADHELTAALAAATGPEKKAAVSNDAFSYNLLSDTSSFQDNANPKRNTLFNQTSVKTPASSRQSNNSVMQQDVDINGPDSGGTKPKGGRSA